MSDEILRRPCPCGRGVCVESRRAIEIRSYADFPGGFSRDFTIECDACARRYEIQRDGAGWKYTLRAGSAAAGTAGLAVEAAAARAMALVARYEEPWLRLFDGKSLDETRRLLPGKWGEKKLARAIAGAIGGREGFLKAQFAPTSLPVILERLGAEDEEAKTLLGAYAAAIAAHERALAEAKRGEIRLPD